MAYAELRGAEIRATIQKLEQRIVARFPGSGLSRISIDLGDLAESAEHEIAWLRKPLWLARVGAISGILGIAAHRRSEMEEPAPADAGQRAAG